MNHTIRQVMMIWQILVNWCFNYVLFSQQLARSHCVLRLHSVEYSTIS